jgi:hypothetical protein
MTDMYPSRCLQLNLFAIGYDFDKDDLTILVVQDEWVVLRQGYRDRNGCHPAHADQYPGRSCLMGGDELQV